MPTLIARRWLLVTAFLALDLSLVGKWLADTFITARIPLAGDMIGLIHVENPGIAFGLTFPPLVQTLLIGAALLLVVGAARSVHGVSTQIGFGLIIGGALGNLLDRALDGLVTDMFQIDVFPVFNVADSCITIGVVLLLWASLTKS